MPIRKCMCKHKEEEHEKVDDSWSKEGGYTWGKCNVPDCKCTHYILNHSQFMYDLGYEDKTNGKEPQEV